MLRSHCNEILRCECATHRRNRVRQIAVLGGVDQLQRATKSSTWSTSAKSKFGRNRRGLCTDEKHLFNNMFNIISNRRTKFLIFEFKNNFAFVTRQRLFARFIDFVRENFFEKPAWNCQEAINLLQKHFIPRLMTTWGTLWMVRRDRSLATFHNKVLIWPIEPAW